MGTGESGVNGVHVLRRVRRENNQEVVNAIHRLHNMEGRNARETQMNIKYAMTMFLVQVFELVFFVSLHNFPLPQYRAMKSKYKYQNVTRHSYELVSWVKKNFKEQRSRFRDHA